MKQDGILGFFHHSYFLGLFENFARQESENDAGLVALHSDVTKLLEISFPEPTLDDEWLTIVAAFWVAFADDDFSFHERREIAKLCSNGEFKEFYDLCINQESPSIFLEQQFNDLVVSLELSKCKSALLLEKIVLIARADGHVNAEEESVLAQVCQKLGLDSVFLNHLLAAA